MTFTMEQIELIVKATWVCVPSAGGHYTHYYSEEPYRGMSVTFNRHNESVGFFVNSSRSLDRFKEEFVDKYTGLLTKNDTLRRWVHVIEVTESMGDVLKRAKLSKAKMQAMMAKTSDPPFAEVGSGALVDNNTLRVLLYKIITATGAKEEHWAAQFGCDPAELKAVLDTVREQVENMED